MWIWANRSIFWGNLSSVAFYPPENVKVVNHSSGNNGCGIIMWILEMYGKHYLFPGHDNDYDRRIANTIGIGDKHRSPEILIRLVHQAQVLPHLQDWAKKKSTSTSWITTTAPWRLTCWWSTSTSWATTTTSTDQIMVSCAQCTRCNLTVPMSFVLTRGTGTREHALCNCSAWVWRAWNSWKSTKLISCFA